MGVNVILLTVLGVTIIPLTVLARTGVTVTPLTVLARTLCRGCECHPLDCPGCDYRPPDCPGSDWCDCHPPDCPGSVTTVVRIGLWVLGVTVSPFHGSDCNYYKTTKLVTGLGFLDAVSLKKLKEEELKTEIRWNNKNAVDQPKHTHTQKSRLTF